MDVIKLGVEPWWRRDGDRVEILAAIRVETVAGTQ